MRSYWNLISVGFLDFSIKWHLSHAKSPDFRQPACSRSLWAGLWSFHGHLTPGVSDKNMGGTCRPIAIWTTRWKLGRVDSGFLRKSMGSEKRNISRASYMEFICNSYGIHIYIYNKYDYICISKIFIINRYISCVPICKCPSFWDVDNCPGGSCTALSDRRTWEILVRMGQVVCFANGDASPQTNATLGGNIHGNIYIYV